MKIAITGSNGFLAQYFCKFTGLNKRDVFFLTTSPPVKGQLLCQSLYSDIDVILNKKNIDTIIHFASVIPVLFSDSDYDLFSKNNKMMRNLYNFSIKSHLKKFIYSSGFGSMNNPKLLDIKDYYTMSKITGEYFCSMMEANNIETASLRISAPYGEFSSARTVLNIFTEKFEKFEKFSLVWVGTSTTYKYILSHANIFIELASLIDYQIIVVASKELSNKFIKGVNMKFYDWSSCNEVELIKKSHIGIMPLDNDNFSQGKSALKLIQYMSSGLPVVASSVGENNIVVSDGKNGFLVKNNTDWVDSIQSLHKDIVLYKNFSEKSLSISGDYSIANYGGKYCNFLKDSFTCL